MRLIPSARGPDDDTLAPVARAALRTAASLSNVGRRRTALIRSVPRATTVIQREL